MQQPDARVIRLADGRDLAWLELGDPDGPPVFIFHGSPGSAEQFLPIAGAADDAHVRLIVPDRPGYGRSSYHRRQSLGDFARDVAQLADHLSLDTFAVAGHSSGGPNAAACARFLPTRVTVCGIISGPAPQPHPGLTDGMLPTNRITTAVCLHWPKSWDPLAVGLWALVFRPLTAAMLTRARKDPEHATQRFLATLPPADAEVLARPEMRANAIDALQHLPTSAARTAMQDMALGIRDWGFRLEDIVVPVHLWHGNLDRNIPIAHAELQAKLIPKATLHKYQGEGHTLYVNHMPEILETLTGAPAAGRM